MLDRNSASSSDERPPLPLCRVVAEWAESAARLPPLGNDPKEIGDDALRSDTTRALET